jgi:predicted membrane protein
VALCYDERMKDTTARVITGAVILAIGAGALLDTFNVIEFWPVFGTWWPLFIILAGVLTLLGDKRQVVWALALILIGGLLQLNNLDITDINLFELIWPVIIIAIGASILMNKSTHPRRTATADSDSIGAIFSGTDTVNSSKNYEGGTISAIFGGVQLDLRDAVIKKEATINVTALCGGIELRVPREWRVRSNVFPILGGVENKSTGDKSDDKSPLLIITGTVALGGVEIKS